MQAVAYATTTTERAMVRPLQAQGLIWLLRGRLIVELTPMEAIIRCRSGATVKFYRRAGPALEIVTVAPTPGPTP
jgi:hypothetical protein